MLILSSTSGLIRVVTGTAWVALDITVAASAPSNLQTNDLRVDIS